jgi:hypothetical protein
VTKAGYFAPDRNARLDPRQQMMQKLVEAAQSTIPFTALEVGLSGVVRHPDTRTVDFTVRLKSTNLSMLPTEDGRNSADLILAAVSLDDNRNILASKIESVVLSTTHDPTKLTELSSTFNVMLRVPRKTSVVRVVMEDREGGRIGAAEFNRKTLESAPAQPSPEPKITQHRSEYVKPTSN